jgi:type IV secretion system protein VirB1
MGHVVPVVCFVGNQSMKATPHTMSILALYLLCVGPSFAQTDNRRFPDKQFAKLAATCAPSIPLSTLYALATTESGLRPYAVSINYPVRAAARLGYRNAVLSLDRQPRDLVEALQWTRWLLRHGYSVSVGLMQVSLETRGTRLNELFDPCRNLQVGSEILVAKYARALALYGPGLRALLSALSDYNTGSRSFGLYNGYVSRVLKAVPSPSAPGDSLDEGEVSYTERARVPRP